MVTDDQHEVIEFLRRPDTYGPGDPPVAHVETHSAMVFLVGDRALKLKRAVRYDYLDFSTVERRRQCCDAEVALNRRVAPSIYRGTAVVTRDADGHLALDGAGSPVEWLVDMNRFDSGRLADRLAEAGTLPLAAMGPLAAAVAALHRGAAQRVDAGGARGMRWVIDGNRRALDDFGAAVFAAPAVARLARDTARALDASAARLDQRRAAGFVRQCHGDLHLGNIVLLESTPTPFDAVEFSDDISCIDVVYDLAFLLMDLWYRDLPRHANLVLNEYLRLTGDLESLALLPLFLSCRAAVRAKTHASAAALVTDIAERGALLSTAHRYLALAHTCLEPPAPALVAIGGLSGTGKSTVAAQVSPLLGAAPGALHLRSDVIRKELAGASPLDRLPSDAYTADASARVHARLQHDILVVLGAGHSVVCDAVFGEVGQRRQLEDLARQASVRLVTVWLDAPENTRVARVAARRDDASDATADVVRRQQALVQPSSNWARVDASGGVEHTTARVIDLLTARGVPTRPTGDATGPASPA